MLCFVICWSQLTQTPTFFIAGALNPCVSLPVILCVWMRCDGPSQNINIWGDGHKTGRTDAIKIHQITKLLHDKHVTLDLPKWWMLNRSWWNSQNFSNWIIDEQLLPSVRWVRSFCCSAAKVVKAEPPSSDVIGTGNGQKRSWSWSRLKTLWCLTLSERQSGVKTPTALLSNVMLLHSEL